MACTLKFSLSGQCNNIRLTIRQLYWQCGLNLQRAVWATYWSPWWSPYHKTIGRATAWLVCTFSPATRTGTLTCEAFHLYVKTVQQAKEQAFDKRYSNKHAKAQVPTNWTQTKSFFPYNREGEKEYFPQCQTSFSRQGGEKEQRQNNKELLLFLSKAKNKNKKWIKSLWCFYSYTNILHKCCNDISKIFQDKNINKAVKSGI